MKDTISNLTPVFRFVGYGTLTAPLWFLGREEALGKRPKRSVWSLEWELGARATWQPVMGMHQAHAHLNDPYWLETQFSPAWTYMALLALVLLHRAAAWQD